MENPLGASWYVAPKSATPTAITDGPMPQYQAENAIAGSNKT
jgi:hypothetical protein